MKLFRFVLVIFVVLQCFYVPIVSASEEQPTLGELKAEYQAKLDEKASYEAMSEEAKAEIAEKEAAIDEVEVSIHASEEEMNRIQESIDASNKEIEKLTGDAKSVLLYLQQMQGENAYVEYVSGASSMTDLITRIAAIEQISNSIQTTMNNLEKEIEHNEQLKVEEENKQKELEKKAQEYQRVIEARYNDIANYDKYALDIDTQVESLKTKLDAAIRNCELYASSKGDDAIVSVDCVKPPQSNTSTGGSGNFVTNDSWLKPLTYGVITSEVGYRWGSYHNALDIGGNAEGTPVYAAAAGVVSGKVERYSCGGNMLYIDVVVNGQAYTTYYYHLLSFAVNIGDVVDQNTIIGYVGGGPSTSAYYGGYDTCTTGAHLHFGVATGFYNGYSVSRSNVITPPGFPNSYGWRFTSRYDMY